LLPATLTAAASYQYRLLLHSIRTTRYASVGLSRADSGIHEGMITCERTIQPSSCAAIATRCGMRQRDLSGMSGAIRPGVVVTFLRLVSGRREPCAPLLSSKSHQQTPSFRMTRRMARSTSMV
jgi:hypothetical protein